jgi:hypothetical protein
VRRTALIVLLLAVARPAWADLTMDSNYTGNMLMAKAKTRMHEQIRDDRSRVETWSTEIVETGLDPRRRDVSEKTRHTIDIVRADKHLRWELEPDSMTYREYSWPDTVETGPLDAEYWRWRARADSMEHVPPKNLPRKTGEQQTINGLKAERLYLRIDADSSKYGSAGLGASELEIWSLVGKQNKEIHRLQEVATRHSLLSKPRSAADSMPFSLADPWAGVEAMVPIRATFKVAMMDSAEAKNMQEKLRSMPADSLQAATSEIYKDIDFATGMLTMFRIDVTEIQLGRVPDDAFEVPAGYKKIATVAPGHSPR